MDVHEVLDALDARGIWPVIDGGWGVDALVGAQSRPHRDLDVVLLRGDLPGVEAALGPLGYRHDATVRPGAPARHVLRAAGGRQVDGHAVIADAGDLWQELDDGSFGVYPATELSAVGTIVGRPVRCVSRALQVRHHAGYEPLSHDLRDLALLDRLTSQGTRRHSSWG